MPPMPKTETLSLDGVRILVVDDNEDAREILGATFTHLGATVATARSGYEALDILGASDQHIIVSDLSMPGMDGLEFMTRVRARPGEAECPTPAIALSGFVQPENRERARRSGYQVFVAKPMDPLLLAQEVARLAAPVAGRPRRS